MGEVQKGGVKGDSGEGGEALYAAVYKQGV